MQPPQLQNVKYPNYWNIFFADISSIFEKLEENNVKINGNFFKLCLVNLIIILRVCYFSFQGQYDAHPAEVNISKSRVKNI